MGVLNVTPDSFSDGGRFLARSAAADRALAMLDEGADVVDIGGESTRPGAAAVGSAEQIDRVVPVIRDVVERRPDALVSIDTTRADVAAAAVEAGAAIVNDVSGSTDDPRMSDVVIGLGVGFIVMHRHTTPDQDSFSDEYHRPPMSGDVVETTRGFLADQLARFRALGGDSLRVVLDPGLGFGKDVGQNMDLIRRTGEIAQIGRPVVSGLSRKSFVGRVSLGRESRPDERDIGTAALTALHRSAGASVFRVHEPALALEALRCADAIGPIADAAPKR